MPASLMTRSEPRPRGTGAGHGSARSARCRAARTGCGPPRTGPRAPDTHRREARERLVAAGVLTPSAAGCPCPGACSSSRGGGRARAWCVTRPPATIGLDRARLRQRRRVASASSRSAVTARSPGSPERAVAAAMADSAGSSEQVDGTTQGIRIERPRPRRGRRRRRATSSSGIGPLVRGGVRVGHHDHRQPGSRGLGQRGRAGPTHEQVGATQRLGHLVAQEGVGSVAIARATSAASHAAAAARANAGSPVMCTTTQRSTRSAMAPATASSRRRTDCEPPKTSSTGSPSGSPSRRAASAGSMPASSRIGRAGHVRAAMAAGPGSPRTTRRGRPPGGR